MFGARKCQRSSWILSLLMLLLGGCQTLPSQKQKEPVSYVGIVEQQVGLYQDPALENQVRRLGYRLVQASDLPPEQFSFYILDQEIPNAFAAPDGSIYVSRGLLALANSEDALAAILAHEISHITSRHHLKQGRRQLIPGLLRLPGLALGKLVNDRLGSLVNAPVNSLGRIYLSSHSRAEEKEADSKGLVLAAVAGYRPEAMAEILSQMDAGNRLIFEDSEGHSFFDSHPSTPGRIDEILRESTKLEPNRKALPPQFATRELFLRSLVGLCFGPNPDYGIRNGETFIHPGHEYVLKMPLGWNAHTTTTLIGAIGPDEASAYFLGLSHYGYDVSLYGQSLKDAFYEEYRLEPFEEQFEVIPQGSRYSLIYRDHSSDSRLYIFFTWIELSGSIFQFIGFGPENQRETLREITRSIRSIRPSDKSDLSILRLRLVEARPGETLAQLGEREKNQWSPEFTAIANNLPSDTRFQGGEWVKIVRREPYQ